MEVFKTDLLLSIKSWIIRIQSFLSNFLAKVAEIDVNLKNIRYPRIIKDLFKRWYWDSYKLYELLPVIPFMQMSSNKWNGWPFTGHTVWLILGIDLLNEKFLYKWVHWIFIEFTCGEWLILIIETILSSIQYNVTVYSWIQFNSNLILKSEFSQIKINFPWHIPV